MQYRRLVITVLALAATLGAAQAQVPFDTAGVRYAATLNLAGAPLQLNGAGIRYKAIFKVYTAGLYLGEKAGTPEAVLAAKGPVRLHVVMLRDIDANELGKLFTRGMQENSPREEFIQMIPGTIRMGEIFAAKKRLLTGESFSVDWVPNAGTSVVVNGKPMGDPIRERAFFNGLLRIWLGKSPADHQLKDALLGKPPQRPNNDGGN
jgi:hypothetical protein